MGFTITGGGGVIDAAIIAMVIMASAIAVVFLVTGARQAREDVIDQKDDERDADIDRD